MTSSGKVRIYELSKDLGLENKDVLDAAEKLSIAAHSSSISDAEAGKIRSLLGKGGNGATRCRGPCQARSWQGHPLGRGPRRAKQAQTGRQACGCQARDGGCQAAGGPEASRSGYG